MRHSSIYFIEKWGQILLHTCQ